MELKREGPTTLNDALKTLTPAFASLDLGLAVATFVASARGLSVVRRAIAIYPHPMVNVLLGSGLVFNAVASLAAILLDASYLYYLFHGGLRNLPFQFPDVQAFAVVGTATALQTFAGALSRLAFSIGVTRGYRFRLAEDEARAKGAAP